MPALGDPGEDQTAAVRGVVPSREDVAADVRKIVGGCRSRGDLLRLDTPALDQLLALERLDHDAGPDLLARGIAAVEPLRYRRFLEILLPLPFAEGERWPSLGPSRRGPGRGDLAAAEFGLDTWDGCTRPSITLDDRSRRDWAELHLATALIQVATGETDEVVEDPPEPVPVAGRWRPRLSVLAAAVAGLLVIALIVAMFVQRLDDSTGDQAAPTTAESSPTTAASPTSAPEGVLGEQCVPVGQLDEELAAEPGAAELAATVRSVYDRATEAAPLGCAISPAARWAKWRDLVVQELASDEADLPAAVVVSGPAAGVVLGPSQWGSYQRIGGADGSRVGVIGGAPQRITDRDDGGVEIELSTGTLLVGEDDDAPFFWIPKDYVAFWRQHPELGLPTGNPLFPPSQDFEHGRAVVELSSPTPVIQLVPDPAAELPAPTKRREHILRQADGTAWWVDRDDRRHWIGTGGVYECLGSDPVMVPDVPGYAIATLTPGDHAECP